MWYISYLYIYKVLTILFSFISKFAPYSIIKMLVPLKILKIKN